MPAGSPFQRLCAWPACDVVILPTALVCDDHWAMLDASIQGRIVKAYENRDEHEVDTLERLIRDGRAAASSA